jgi:lipopolysaccharide export system protein LptC
LLNRSLPLLPLGVLVLLVGLTFWLSSFVQFDAARKAAAARHEPDLIVEKFAARKLSEKGDVQYRVNAEKMMHFADDDSSTLDNVVFDAIQPGQPKMTAHAPRGQLLRGGDEIILDGGVLVESTAMPTMPAMTIRTPKLTVLPNQNIAKSVDGVVIERADGTITAATLELNSATRIANLGRGSLLLKPTR